MAKKLSSGNQAAPGATRELARFLARTRLADMPAEVITRAKHLMLD